MRIDDPWWLILLILPLSAFFYGRRKKAVLVYPTVKVVKRVYPSLRMRLRYLPEILKLTALSIMIVALSRPQITNSEREVSTKGTDIILTLDISGSMQAEDFEPRNRLFVAKEVLKSFIKGRSSDRIGLVAFAGEAYTQSPLTMDYGVLLSLVDELEIGRYKDGTAIGMAIAESAKRLKDSEAKSKIIILLTDGVNNIGNIEPLTAARIASALGVKIYTIGVGREGGAPIPVMDPIFGKGYARDNSGNIILTEMDEDTLKEVASISGARYYRATSKDSLIKVYSEIDSLEKTDIKVREYYSYTELYPWLLFAAAGLLLLSFTLRATWLWSYP